MRAVYEFILDEVDDRIGIYIRSNKLKPKTTSKGHPRYETALGI